MAERGLNGIWMESGVTAEGKPFVTVKAESDDGVVSRGQLSPDEVRQHALSYLEAAEAADQDALVQQVVSGELGQNEAALHLISAIRHKRGMR